MRLMIAVVAQLALVFAAATSQAGPESPAPVHTRNSRFRIPYRYDPDEMQRLAAQEIRLFASIDRGATWRHVQTVAPAAGRFDFKTPGDGEYWFSVRTLDGQGRLYPPGDIGVPGLKVIVDSTPPRFEIAVRQLQPGRVQLAWRSNDPNIDPDSLRLEYLQEGRTEWQRVSVIPQATGQTSWSVPQGGVVAVRGSVTDKAANTARSEAQTRLAPAVGTAPRRPPVPSYDEPIAKRNDTGQPAPSINQEQFGLPKIAGKTAVPKSTSKFVSSSGREPSFITRRQVPIEKEKTLVEQKVEEQAETATDADDSSGRRIVRETQFDINYEIGDVGPSGVGAVEFYITRNGGQQWYKLGDDLDRRSPFNVKVPGDGVYGFEIRVRSGVGLAADPPQPGEAPSVVITVDQTPPVIQLYPVQQGQGASLNKIRIRWQAEDENPAPKSVSLAYSSTPEGPWTLIRDWEKDAGTYLWNVTDNVAPKLYIAVSVRDAAGNLSRAVTSKPIIVDLKKPSAKIVGVKPPEKR